MYNFFGDYISVAKKRANAEKEIKKLKQKGFLPQPIAPFKGKIASSFWGKSWCDNLSHYADYYNRLERGRSYVRNGCVCHLDIRDSCVKALVSGSSLYKVEISLTPMMPDLWKKMCLQCSSNTGSLLELMKGKLSDEVMKIVSSREGGLFPEIEEIYYSCSCPDGALLCKHVAAVLYAIGRKLDENPQLLFDMRGVDPHDLASVELDAIEANSQGDIAPDSLKDIFGVDIDINSEDSGPVKTYIADKITSPEVKKESKKETIKIAPIPTKKISQRRKKTNEEQIINNYNPSHPSGQNIRDMQVLSVLSLKDMAREIGVSYATLRNWQVVNGEINMNHDSVKKVEKFYKKLVRENKKRLDMLNK